MLNRVVALKKMLPETAASASAVKQFGIEAQITAQLEHPGRDPGPRARPAGRRHPLLHDEADRRTDPGGTSSRRAIRRGTLARLIDVLIKVCEAVAYAHARGVVHRDLAPKNLMVGDFGEVLVVDWGLAGLVGELAKQGGTPGYMADEQASGALTPSDPRCVVPGRDSCGRSSETAARAELVSIADKAQADDPSQRYPTAAELADDLKAWAPGRPGLGLSVLAGGAARPAAASLPGAHRHRGPGHGGRRRGGRHRCLPGRGCPAGGAADPGPVPPGAGRARDAGRRSDSGRGVCGRCRGPRRAVPRRAACSLGWDGPATPS